VVVFLTSLVLQVVCPFKMLAVLSPCVKRMRSKMDCNLMYWRRLQCQGLENKGSNVQWSSEWGISFHYLPPERLHHLSHCCLTQNSVVYNGLYAKRYSYFPVLFHTNNLFWTFEMIISVAVIECHAVMAETFQWWQKMYIAKVVLFMHH
jgi:hypothetical protein